MEENGDPQRESSISLLDDENRDVPAVGLLVPPGVVGSAWCRGTSSATGRPRAVVPEDFCTYARVTRSLHLTAPLAGSGHVQEQESLRPAWVSKMPNVFSADLAKR